MKQKKYYKTWKFWITSLLALSASSIITSLTLTSCAANSTVNKNDIVITDQSGDQEFSIDDNKDLTLTVEATSNSGANLRYQWYVNKTTDDSSWQKIKGATSKTYTIPISDIQDIDSQTTWKYKAEIYHENNENLRVESKPIPVKIVPPTGGSVPENPSIPENKPDQPTPTPPTPTPPAPDLNPDEPSNPSEPTPPDNPPSNPDTPSTPDNPSIVPSPEYQPSKGIGARLPLDKNGIVTTKYDQEQWIGDNSVSLMIEAKPNANGIANAVNKLKETAGLDSNIRKMLDSMVGTINNADKYSYNQFGTGWILDYSNNSKDNLTDYYIATNMHVLNSYFELIFDSSRYSSYGYEESIKVGVRIPFNKTTVSNLNVYISQPKYSLKDQKYNDKSYADQLSSQWYKTNVNIENWTENLIPIGAYNTEGGNKGFEYSQAFDMELTWQYESNSNLKQTLYFKSNSNGGYLTKEPEVGNESFQHGIDDFSVFKIGLANNAFDSMIAANNEYSKMFQSMKNLFSTTTNVEVKKNSSYISKLNKLLDITENNAYNKENIDELFMFGESSNITKDKTQISIGGYPLIQEKVPSNNTYKWESYTTFNTNTLTGNNIIDYPPNYYHTRDRMGINQYTYKGNLYKIKWKDPNNYILKNVNLLAGSSGGVGIDQNYKLSCINWGTFIQIEYYQGIKYVLDSSSSTGLYTSNDKNSLIWKWVDYSIKNNKQTKLAELFTRLEKFNYFK